MPLTDIGVALQISFTYFTILYLTGLGGLFSERSGIVNIGLEGLMIIGTVTGAWGARYFTDTVGLGLPWGPILGLLFGAFAGLLFAGVHAARDDHVPGRPHRVGRRDQPRRDRARAVPVAGVLRPGDAVRPGRSAPEPDRHPAAVVAAVGTRAGVPGLIARGLRRAPDGVPGVVRAVPNAVGSAAAVVRREPRGRRVRSACASRRTATRACCSPVRSPGCPARSSRPRSSATGARARRSASGSSRWPR